MRTRSVMVGSAVVAAAAGGGLAAATVQATIFSQVAGATDNTCVVSTLEGPAMLSSPEFFPNFDGSGNIKDSLDMSCEPESSPPFVGTAAASSLWKDVSGTWHQIDPSTSGQQNTDLGIWDASTDDDGACGTWATCQDGNTWKQVWSTSSIIAPPQIFEVADAPCVAAGSAVTCSSVGFYPA